MGSSSLSELLFVKLGGSVITDKDQVSTPRPQVIERLAGEVRAALDANPSLRILLGHGSGSFGHRPARQYHVQQGIADQDDWWGYAETGATASQLNRIVTDTFVRCHVPVVSIQPSASARACGGELISIEDYAVREALRHGLVPMVHGDVAFDSKQGCTIISTEAIFVYLARQLCPARLILVGEVDGVYDHDPVVDPTARHIPRITPLSFARLKAGIGGSHAVDVTGGMLSKVESMVQLVAQHTVNRVHVLSGQRQGALTRSLIEPDTAGGTVIEHDPPGIRKENP
jgi:isopentenyl phosphate kinase